MVQRISSSCTLVDCLAHTTLRRPLVQLVTERNKKPLQMSIPWNSELAVSVSVRPKSGVTFLIYDIGTLAGQLFPDNLALAKCHPWTVWAYKIVELEFLHFKKMLSCWFVGYSAQNALRTLFLPPHKISRKQMNTSFRAREVKEASQSKSWRQGIAP